MEIELIIKKLRELRNYSQEYMAENIGVSQVTYSRMETGQTKLNISRMQQIAEVLEIDLIRLFSFDEDEIFCKTTPSQRKHISTCDRNCFGEAGRNALVFHIIQLENQLKALRAILGLQENN